MVAPTMAATVTGCPAKIRAISTLTAPIQSHHSLMILCVTLIMGKCSKHSLKNHGRKNQIPGMNDNHSVCKHSCKNQIDPIRWLQAQQAYPTMAIPENMPNPKTLNTTKFLYKILICPYIKLKF